MPANKHQLELFIRLTVILDENGRPPSGFGSREGAESILMGYFENARYVWGHAGIRLRLHGDQINFWQAPQFYEGFDEYSAELAEAEYRQGRPWINVYYVNKINRTGSARGRTFIPSSSTGNSAWCVLLVQTYYVQAMSGRDKIDVSYQNSWQVLAHEIGHILGLPHLRFQGGDTPATPDGEALNDVAMWPFEDDTVDIVEGDPASHRNIMTAYDDHSLPEDPEQFSWTENQIKRARLTYFACHSEFAYAAYQAEGEEVMTNTRQSHEERIPPRFASAFHFAWSG